MTLKIKVFYPLRLSLKILTMQSSLFLKNFFKKWDNIIYMDADFVINGDINNLIKQINDENKFLCDFEGIKLNLCLKQNENYEKLNQKYGINNINVFNSGCLVF